MKRHFPIILASISVFIILWLVGVFLELTNVIPAGLGTFVGLSAYVVIWYYFLRKNKPVWQPGRRFWLRWLALSVGAAVTFILELDFFSYDFYFFIGFC